MKNQEHLQLSEPPRRLTRKQAHKWSGSKSTPKFLRHVGGGYARLRDEQPTINEPRH